jgi:polyisoprenoid-binding protein YceI
VRIFFKATLLVLILVSVGAANEYGVGPLNEKDTIYFNSTAKLEFIKGTTQQIEGGFSFDPANPTAGVSGIVRVDLRTLKTGIEKRDEHMRDNHLHTDKYPYAYFELKSAEPVLSLTTFDSAYTTKASGNFYIHGNYRKLDADLILIIKKLPTGVETIDIRANFSINLDDYKIPRPKALFLKLAETIEIEAVISGTTGISHNSVELPDWSQLK